LQLCGATYVKVIVKERDKMMKVQQDNMARRFVRVAPPTIHAGVGDALRRAFRMEAEVRSERRFDELLALID